MFCVAYLDDILVFSSDRESHTIHIREVLERMRKAELYAKLAKCKFYRTSVEFLGYIIGRDGISMDPKRIETIKNWPLPRTFREVQVFLGFCNYYRRFIYDFSRIARPLTDLTKGMDRGRKPGSVDLGPDEKLAFRRLIDAFQQAPLLRHFDPRRQIRLETDASNSGMARILS